MMPVSKKACVIWRASRDKSYLNKPLHHSHLSISRAPPRLPRCGAICQTGEHHHAKSTQYECPVAECYNLDERLNGACAAWSLSYQWGLVTSPSMILGPRGMPARFTIDVQNDVLGVDSLAEAESRSIWCALYVQIVRGWTRLPIYQTRGRHSVIACRHGEPSRGCIRSPGLQLGAMERRIVDINAPRRCHVGERKREQDIRSRCMVP